jgi:hypothetical protein
MKTRIKKIILMAVALLFVSVGVSFAHDFKGYSRMAPGNTYGHYKKGNNDRHPGWNKKHPEPRHNFRDRHRHWTVHKVHHHYHPKFRHVTHGRKIIGFKANNPGYKIVVVVKDRR